MSGSENAREDHCGSDLSAGPAGSAGPDRAGATIGIAIPFHRGLAYLQEAVESVRAQTDDDWRLVVGDDGAGDEGAEDYLAGLGDPRIVYRKNARNLGMIRNWNQLLDSAETELVTLLHQDDALQPNYVALMRGLAEQHADVVAFYCGASIVGEDGQPCFSFVDWIKGFLSPGGRADQRAGALTRLAGEDATSALIRGNFIMCPTLCYHRPLLAQRRFDERWKQVQDLELTTRLLLEGETLLGSGELGYVYRRHRASATHVQSESFLRFDEESALFDLLAERCAEHGWSRAARHARKKRILKLHLAYRILGNLLTLHLPSAGRQLGYLLRKL